MCSVRRGGVRAWNVFGRAALDVTPMKPVPRANYQTPEQLAERIKQREEEAALLPPGAARQSVLIEIARLRAYADIKLWLSSGR
jgi:hypothetical protein